MPRVAPSVLRFVPLLLASTLFSSPAWASCAPDAGQEQQEAVQSAPPQENPPAAAPAQAEADAGNEARAALAAIGRLDDADTAQFTMVGEQHGSGSIAEFETALHKALAARGYTHSALEIGPFSTRYVEQLIRSGPGKLQDYVKAPGNGFAIPFLFFGEEAAMAEQMVAQSPDRKAALWGLDQEFIGGAPVPPDIGLTNIFNV